MLAYKWSKTFAYISYFVGCSTSVFFPMSHAHGVWFLIAMLGLASFWYLDAIYLRLNALDKSIHEADSTMETHDYE